MRWVVFVASLRKQTIIVEILTPLFSTSYKAKISHQPLSLTTFNGIARSKVYTAEDFDAASILARQEHIAVLQVCTNPSIRL